jgi:heme exporter protein CcmB
LTSGIRAAFKIARKDIVSQIRKKFEIFSMLLFALIAGLVFSFALPTALVEDLGGEAAIGAALIWVIVFFTGMFGFAPIFLSESESGTLRGLSVAPIPAWSVYIGKVIYGFVLMVLVEIFIIPIIQVLFGFTMFNDEPLLIVATLLIGTLDLAAVGSMASALTMPSESKATIFPLVYFPTATSGLILLTEITRVLATGTTIVIAVGLTIPILFIALLAHLVAMITLSAVVFNFALSP